jgi:ADP-dependent NAD(P)H-hydrate dehydratase / NAD(P)H-hydrate epimerase
MQKVLTAQEMREVDRLTTEKYGIPSLLLMENAAHAAARVINEKLGGSVAGKSVLVLCGKGNNGGDGAALARILWNLGATVQVFLFGKVEDTKGDARINFETLQKIDSSPDVMEFADGVHLYLTEIDDETEWHEVYSGFNEENIIIDALFGTGLSREIVGNAVGAIETFNYWKNSKYNPLVVSLDIPSGLNADLSQPIGENFQADLTVTFTAPKLANVFPPASNFNGELVVAKIGSPQELIENSPSKLFLAEKGDAQDWLNLTKLQPDSYKKIRGTALIIAGSENYSGAAVLAANACFAAGAGMVTVAVSKEIHQIVAAKTADEIIVKPLENTENSKVDVIALGCGLANDNATHNFIRETVENRQMPMVLDAEALNALSPFELQGSDEFPLILTPHIGEFTRLLGREIGENRISEVREFSRKHNVILVLKGERSLVAKPDGTVVINPTGNAGISRAGAGDTLTGIITSFLAQTFAIKETNIENAFEAVVAALYIAGLAGDIAAEKFSQRLLTATDVRSCLNNAIEKINR